MKILVINCGSSSLKYQLYNMEDNSVLAKGLVERIGIEGSNLQHTATGKDKKVFEQPLKDHGEAIKLVMDKLTDKEVGVIADLKEIDGIGHRVLHGSKYFSCSVLVDQKVKDIIRSCFDLGPLHMPANLMGIEACEKLMPGKPNVAVFDTAFHQTMPPKAYMYALPYEYYEKYDIRRYGFHGTSHMFVTQRAIAMLGGKAEGTKIITCHLGNGSSIAAVKDGKVIDTSMGLTPLEGLVMGTRCGDIDPAIVPFIMNKEKLSPDEMDTIMNKKSGILGISGESSDFRDVEEKMNEGNEKAKIALEMFRYKVAKYIGEYYVALGGCDAVVFTAGIGENNSGHRAAICKYLECLGMKIDEEKNATRGREIDFAAPDSKMRAFIIPTNEELMIAEDTKKLLDK
ncbi:MAG: acetate kinase [Firmicutes bacterium]|nr:acetate kinase [Bacillota bacterium]